MSDFPCMLKKFLCCLNLKNGVLFIGVANVVSSVLLILASIPVSVIVGLQRVQMLKYDRETYNAQTYQMLFISVVVIMSVLHLAAVPMLIHGVRTKKPGLLRPWIYLASFTILLIFGSIFTCFSIKSSGLETTNNFIIEARTTLILFGFCPLPFVCYFLLCVASYRKHLIDEEAAKPDEARSTLVG